MEIFVYQIISHYIIEVDNHLSWFQGISASNTGMSYCQLLKLHISKAMVTAYALSAAFSLQKLRLLSRSGSQSTDVLLDSTYTEFTVQVPQSCKQ